MAKNMGNIIVFVHQYARRRIAVNRPVLIHLFQATWLALWRARNLPCAFGAGVRKIGSGQTVRDRSDHLAPLEDAIAFIENCKKIGYSISRFGCAQEEITAARGLARGCRVVRIMTDIKALFLRLAIKVDQQIATNDQIEPGKRWVLNQVVDSEEYNLAHFRFNATPFLFFDKETLQTRWRNILADRAGIEAATGKGNRFFVDIGGKELQARRFFHGRCLF